MECQDDKVIVKCDFDQNLFVLCLKHSPSDAINFLKFSVCGAQSIVILAEVSRRGEGRYPQHCYFYNFKRKELAPFTENLQRVAHVLFKQLTLARFIFESLIFSLMYDIFAEVFSCSIIFFYSQTSVVRSDSI